MINYTERISVLMRDIVARVPRLSYIDSDDLLVFARYGRPGAEGAFATCHCISLPPTEPGYYYWRDRQTGRITRRSRWFVTKSPSVSVGGRRIHYLISFALPRFCDQTLAGSRKEHCYDQRAPTWLAKLDTVVHELYHIDPSAPGIRRVERADGVATYSSHGRDFLADVADMVREYLATRPDPATFDFLRHRFSELEEMHAGVLGTTFRTFPSFPQRYIDVLPNAAQPETPASVRIQTLKTSAVPTRYTEDDLVVRQFLACATRRLSRRDTRRESPLVRQMRRPDGAPIERAAAGQ
ncbi:MAG TPA: hypothetical protein VGK32_15585 [Vicinamibacterales bacterium]|jgi:hypothetical protein